MRLRLLVLAMPLALAEGAAAAAGGELAEMYRRQTQAVLTALESKGLAKIACDVQQEKKSACLSPALLKERLAEVRFIVGPFDEIPGRTRRTAFYLNSPPRIHLNAATDHDPSMAGYIGLHELLGIAGVDEFDYEITSAVYLATRFDLPSPLKENVEFHIRKRPKAPNVKTPFDRSNGPLPASGGGATVVGSGGDGESFRQRMLFYEYLIRSAQPFTRRTALWNSGYFSRFPLEIVESEARQVRFVRITAPKQMQRIQFLVPRGLLREPPLSDEAAPNRALEEIAFYLSGIHPFFPQFKKTRIVPYECGRTGKKFLYPEAPELLHPKALAFHYRPLWKLSCPDGGAQPGEWKR